MMARKQRNQILNPLSEPKYHYPAVGHTKNRAGGLQLIGLGQ